MRTYLWILAGALVLAGCSATTEKPASEGAAKQAAPAATYPPATSATPGGGTHAQSAVPASGEAVTLVGTSGCGHCTFGVGQSCAAAMKTADGTLYVLDGVDPESDLFKSRMDSKSLKVVGQVSQQDGLNHVAMTSYEIL
jgi:hypothetical protein